jgi:hypothetical protein
MKEYGVIVGGVRFVKGCRIIAEAPEEAVRKALEKTVGKERVGKFKLELLEKNSVVLYATEGESILESIL